MNQQFEQDMRYSMLDEQALQSQMLEDILHTVEQVNNRKPPGRSGRGGFLYTGDK